MFKKALLAMVCLAGVALAGPLDKQQVPAGAKWLLHGDVETLMASKLGQKIQEEAAKPGPAQMPVGNAQVGRFPRTSTLAAAPRTPARRR